MYDVIVVGARCAGSPTAMLLAQQGYRVLLLDKGHFPSDKRLSTHVVVRPGGAMLQEWGLLDSVKKTNCPPLSTFAIDYHSLVHFEATPPGVDGVDAVYAPRRILLDDILLKAAIRAGVEFREGFVVEDLLWDEGHVVGAQGRSRDSSLNVSEQARLVVGADGLGSVVARRASAAAYHTTPTLTAAWFGYWSGVPAEKIRVFFRPHRFFVALATNDNLTLIVGYIPIEEAHEFRADAEQNFMRDFEANVPDLYEAMQAGRCEEHLLGTEFQPNYFRVAGGPGWALVGDAGRHHDSINPSGITNAFIDASFLTDAINEGFSGRTSMSEALATYQRRRDERWSHHHEFALQMTALPPATPEMAGFMQALATKPDLAGEFAAFFEGQEAHLDFMSPQKLQRLAA